MVVSTPQASIDLQTMPNTPRTMTAGSEASTISTMGEEPAVK